MIYIVTALLVLVVVLGYFLYKAIMGMVQASEQVTYIAYAYADMIDAFSYFRDHIEQVNEMEMYYGDETLKRLLEHSQDIVKDIEDFGKLFQKAVNEAPVLVIREEGDFDDEEEEEE